MEPQSKELREARERYTAALTVATKPVTDRYLQQLEQMKRKAMSARDLPLATEIDAEIKRLSPVPTSAAVKTDEDLTRYLAGTSWSWGLSVGSANSKLVFKADGTCVINDDLPVRWQASDDSTLKLENGTVIKLHSNRKAYTAETASGVRVGVKEER